MIGALFRVVRRSIVAAVIVGSGLAVQYVKLQAQADENRRLLEAKMNAVETRLLEDSQSKFDALSKTVEDKTDGLQTYCRGEFQSVRTQIQGLDEKLTARLDGLETRSQELLTVARTNERRIALLILHFGQADGTLSH